MSAGCPACRDRRGLVVVRRVREGTSAPWGGEEPAPCPRCGEVPEQVLEIAPVVVSSREEVARLTPAMRAEVAEVYPLPSGGAIRGD